MENGLASARLRQDLQLLPKWDASTPVDLADRQSRAQLPRWNGRNLHLRARVFVNPQKRTLELSREMSALCQKKTLAQIGR